LGSSSLITNLDGEIVQHVEYVPFGEVFIEERNNVWNTPYLFNAKELDEETGLYYYGARYYDPRISLWLSTDPLACQDPNISAYTYTLNNPIKLIDPDGMAWKPTKNENTQKNTGYQWVPEDQSYNEDGTLKKGLYAQAIFFTHNGTFDENKNFNMGSATAHVYKSDGTTITFKSSTLPANSSKYATVPEGLYEAKVGTHTGSSGKSYTALRMSDIGTIDFKNSRIELGTTNPAHSDGRTYTGGLNIHKAGLNDLTGLTSKGSPVSAGCSLIPISSWNNFIGIFDNKAQRSNVISVTMSRTYSTPSNRDVMRISLPKYQFQPYVAEPDALRVAIRHLPKIF
jgi:RHS repeat-associated protein